MWPAGEGRLCGQAGGWVGGCTVGAADCPCSRASPMLLLLPPPPPPAATALPWASLSTPPGSSPTPRKPQQQQQQWHPRRLTLEGAACACARCWPASPLAIPCTPPRALPPPPPLPSFLSSLQPRGQAEPGPGVRHQQGERLPRHRQPGAPAGDRHQAPACLPALLAGPRLDSGLGCWLAGCRAADKTHNGCTCKHAIACPPLPCPALPCRSSTG